MLVNPGFESDLSGWFVNDNPAVKAWNSADADGCPASGSLKVSGGEGDIEQCVAAKPNAVYAVGLRYIQSVGGSFTCFVTFFGDSACTNPIDDPNGPTTLRADTGASSWTNYGTTVISPTGTVSVQILCGSGGTANLDQFYINAAGSY
jgi:hypothetical protein